jgi:hypothetical protein
MWPWNWIFAPLTYLPLSGAVSQDFTLDTFFRAMGPSSADPTVEKRAVEQASYGRQLGWLTDVLVGSTDPATLRTKEARVSFESLKGLHAKIDHMKAEQRHARVDDLIARLQRLAIESPEDLQRVLRPFM